MRKQKPNFPLVEVKKLVAAGRCKLVETAKQTAYSLGFSETEAKDVVASLESQDFRKSETDFHNNSSWQDYYSKKVKDLRLFIKLKIAPVDGGLVLILSFKRDENVEGGQ